MPLDVLDVVQLRGKRILDVDDEDFPVGLALVEESHDTENLDLLDLPDVADLFADLTNVQGVIVALRLRLGVHLGGILPGLNCTHPSASLSETRGQGKASETRHDATHLGESAVVPDVTVVGETVAHETEAALLDVLLDGVHRLLLRDLHLRVRPAGDLDDHVEDAVVLVGEEGDVVEGGDDIAALLDEDAMV